MLMTGDSQLIPFKDIKILNNKKEFIFLFLCELFSLFIRKSFLIG